MSKNITLTSPAERGTTSFTKLLEKDAKEGYSKIDNGSKLFCDHLNRYIEKQPENYDLENSPILDCLKAEIAVRAKNKAILSFEKNPKGISESSVEEKDEDTKKEIGDIAKEKTEETFTNLIEEKKVKDLSAFIRTLLKQETKGKEKKSKKKPIYPGVFTTKVLEYLNDGKKKVEIQDYLWSVYEECSIWIHPKCMKQIPITHPNKVRTGFASNKKKIEGRGFQKDSNPTSPIGNSVIVDGKYKGAKIGSGLWDNHIWYDTTRAPPMFTFIPNHVWTPQLIYMLTDKCMGSEFIGEPHNIVPTILKEYSFKVYGRKKSQLTENKKNQPKAENKPSGQNTKDEKKKSLELIINGTWEGLNSGTINTDCSKKGGTQKARIQKTPIERAMEKHENVIKKSENMENGKPCVNKVRIKDHSGRRENIRKLITYIKDCKEKEVSPKEEGKPKQEVEQGAEEKFVQLDEEVMAQEYEEEKKKNPLTPGNKNTKDFKNWIENKKKKMLAKDKEEGGKNYREELKKMIQLSKNDDPPFKKIHDLETWLKSYYKALTTINNKKGFLKDLKNPKLKVEDIKEKYQLSKREIDQNVKGVLGQQNVQNVEEAREYLSNRNVEDVLKESDTSKEKDPEEVQITSEELKILIEALCNREGKSTEDFKKAKEDAQQKATEQKKKEKKTKTSKRKTT